MIRHIFNSTNIMRTSWKLINKEFGRDCKNYGVKSLNINTLNPVVVLVPSSLSRQQSGHGTSTNTIFINFLKKSIGSIGFRFVPLDPSMFLVSATMISFFPTLIHALWLRL